MKGDEQVPFCGPCWAALEGGEVPPIDFKVYFSEGMERKLKEVDSLLFDLSENFFLWYLKGHLEHELGSTKKALNSIRTSLSYKEDYGDPWIRLGLIYSDMHRESEAIQHFKRGLDHPLMDPSNLVDAGISLQASDQLSIASRILGKALDLVPDDDRALVALGKVYVQMGELDKAKEVLGKGLELYPHNEEVLRGMAQILLRIDDLSSAMEMYSRILDQHPRDFEALLAKGEIHLRKGELSHSIKAYQAVNELDIHISWTGILKFICSMLRSIVNRNENSLSYREDLKKEYDNIHLFLDRLDEKISNASGSDVLGELESLIKVMENLRLNLKDQVVKFEDLLARYKVDDSFHQHLEGKVEDLKKDLSNSRLFDAKQIALELSPFLADLGAMSNRNEEKLKEVLRSKLQELREIDMENPDLEIRLEEVDKLGREGNHEGAAFMVKEIEVSLEEFWIDASRRYHEERYALMEDLLEKARNQFDTSALTDMFRSYRKEYEKGPRAVREGYQEFQKRYELDSASYFRKESERVLNEIDLKLTILEKDGANVSRLREESEDLSSELEKTNTPKELHDSSRKLLEQLKVFEEKQQVSMIRERLRNLDLLLGQMDFLGMDDEMARNVEPVRRVIERSLKQQNIRLSEILTNELHDNIQKILKENYRSQLGELVHSTEGELLRLKGLGVDKKEWTITLDRCKRILKGEEKGPMSELVNHLARIQTDIRSFMMKRLPKEIDMKLRECRDLLEEGSVYGLNLVKEETSLDRLMGSAEEISSLDLLEDAYRFERNVTKKLHSFISRSVRERNEKVRKGIDKLIDLEVENHSVMDIISMLSKADMQLDNGKEKEAFELMKKAEIVQDEIRLRTLAEVKENRMSEIERLLKIADSLGMDPVDILNRRTTLLMKKDSDPEDDVTTSTEILDMLISFLNEGARGRYEGYKETVREFLRETAGLIPEEMPGEIKAQIREIKDALKMGTYEELQNLFSSLDVLLEKGLEKAREKAYLDRCSKLIEVGLGIKDRRSKELVKKLQELADRIRGGKMEDVEKELSGLQKEISSLRSFVQMQDIENTLTQIKELDELARDVLSPMEQDGPFRERFEPLNDRISRLLERTTSLYNDPDPELSKELTRLVSELREEIMEIEQEWRAKKRLDTLSDMGLTAGNVEDDLLAEDIDNLSSQFKARDWGRFFRTWERVEGHVRKMEKKGALPGGSFERIEGAAPGSPGLEVLSRKKVSRRSKGKTQENEQLGNRIGGIKRLAMDMAAKRKLMEGPGKEDTGPVSAPGDGDIVEMARSVAGSRIEELKLSSSKALEEGEDLPPIGSSDPEREGEIKGIMKDFMEIDTSPRKKLSRSSAEEVKRKLVRFFEIFPPMNQLNESRTHFEKGNRLLDEGEQDRALKEYRLSLTQAIRIGKVHSDLGKALEKIETRLGKGIGRKDIRDHYEKARELFGEGDLMGCARAISSVKDMMAVLNDQDQGEK